ncbi:MAG: efflux RND transporter periplasmic adaptor subunit [Thermoguttaceae bacterium]
MTARIPPFILLSVLSLLSLAGCEVRPAAGPVAYAARQGAFVHDLLARGTVFSEAGTEVRCEVDGASPEGTMILEIVPEGTSVQPGDMLVHLDTSSLKEELLQQQIRANDVEAEVAAAGNQFEKARLSLDEYLGGLFPEEKKAAENELFAAERKLARAQHTLEAAESGGPQPEDSPVEDIDALRFDVEMAKRDIDGAKTRISVLESYTRPLRLKQLEGETKAAEARMRAKENELSIQNGRLAKIEKQIADCTIVAPVAGVVFYENVPAENPEEEVVIGDGVPVRRRQVILRIAQMDQLSVRTEVAESDIAQLRADMPASVLVDSMPEAPFEGHVTRIHPYPTRETRGSTGNKRYELHVAIDNPSGTLRPGLAAEVILTLAQVENAIQVPQSAVFEENNGEYCLVRSRNRWIARPVVTGPTDGKITVIRKGLEAGEEVAIQPGQFRPPNSP